MKSLLLTLTLMGFTMSSSNPGTMSKGQREYLVDYLKETEKGLLKTIKGLSEEQWTFKPSDDVWSIAEICDHIMKVEDRLMQNAKNLLETPPQLDKDIDMDARVKAVLDVISEKNRKTKKFPVAPGTEPSDTNLKEWQKAKTFASVFKKKRDENIKYIKTTDDALLHHYNPLIEQLGEMNSYLWIVFMSAHNARHTAQIKEVMEHSSFPAK